MNKSKSATQTISIDERFPHLARWIERWANGWNKMRKKRRIEPPILQRLEEEFERIRDKTPPPFPYDPQRLFLKWLKVE